MSSPTELLAAASAVGVSYLCGSVPTGVLLARSKGIDLTRSGSGNIGATNAYRVAGRTVGLLTLAGDVVKGVVPVWAVRALGFSEGVVCAAGFAAFIGHLFPLFLRFHGGKGVATALGVFLGLAPASILPTLTVFGVTLWRWRIVSLASCAAALSLPLVLGALGAPASRIVLGAAIALLVMWRHRENFLRLGKGKEPRLSL